MFYNSPEKGRQLSMLQHEEGCVDSDLLLADSMLNSLSAPL